MKYLGNIIGGMTTPCFIAIIVLFLLLMASNFWGFHIGTQSMQDAAVKAGKAEYYLDPDNFRQWRWKQ